MLGRYSCRIVSGTIALVAYPLIAAVMFVICAYSGLAQHLVDCTYLQPYYQFLASHPIIHLILLLSPFISLGLPAYWGAKKRLCPLRQA